MTIRAKVEVGAASISAILLAVLAAAAVAAG